ARLDRGPPADPHRLPTLLRRPAVPPPGLHTGARDDRARLCPRPGVGLPGPAFPPAGPSQLAAGPRLRSAAATARPVRAQAEPRTQGTGSKRTHLRLRCVCRRGSGGMQSMSGQSFMWIAFGVAALVVALALAAVLIRLRGTLGAVEALLDTTNEE